MVVKHFLTATFIALLFFVQSCYTDNKEIRIDPNGYVIYCPCMGRFGNQADQFLGALAFCKSLDRTMVLPPWVEYGTPGLPSIQIPFDTYFKVEPLATYHRVMTMEEFMKQLAPTIWPVGERKGFCHVFREGQSCKMKDGNPFGPFWDNFNVDFDSYTEFGHGLNWESSSNNAKEWQRRFPASEFPVLAFPGAPGSFPVVEQNVPLHHYLVWSDNIEKQADEFIKKNIPDGSFLGLHMRNGMDWVNVCDNHLDSAKDRHIFGSPQCLGYNFEHGQLTKDMCFPPRDLVKKQVRRRVKMMKGVTAVFVAADADAMIKDLGKAVDSRKVRILQYEAHEPHVELAILAKADHYIGNCLSTFSAFAARERLVHNKSSSFWAFDKEVFNESQKKERKRNKKSPDDEL